MYNKANEILCGDCLERMKETPDNTFDSFVTDPPYGLKFMGKDWDHGVPGVHFWKEFLRTAKPGAHLLAFGGPRTHHRLMVAIEDAGWEIRDCLMWVYGSGFPKSLDVSKAIDKAAGRENVVGAIPDRWTGKGNCLNFSTDRLQETCKITAPCTDSAKQWSGWGTALKPAWEPIILARKPLEGTVAENVQKWGCGGINVDGCRVDCEARPKIEPDRNRITGNSWQGGIDGSLCGSKSNGVTMQGRFPANLIHDGSDEVIEQFPANAGAAAPVKKGFSGKSNGIYGDFGQKGDDGATFRGDSGSAARFFYCAKASKSERGFGNTHPTVKPLSLMQYLCRLITPPNGLICDPFCGSGSTCIAAIKEGFNYVGIDKDQSSVDIANKRIFDNI